MRDPYRPEPARILRRTRETSDTFTLELDAASAFSPGQFNMLYVFGVGEVAISISGDPGAGGPVVHTIRALGTVTRAIERLGRGDVLGLRGPYGTPWPMEAAEGGDLVVVAGGLGLAPLRPAIHHALRRRDRYQRVAVLVGARSPADLVYAKELARWAKRADLRVELTVDHADPTWTGRVGVAPALLDCVEFDPARTTALVCGPEVMMRFTIRALAARGVPAERIHLSLERNMRCALGFCGHCQYGPTFVCKDGPVVPYPRVAPRLDHREV